MVIRTIKQAAAIIRANDPETPITEKILRVWVRSGALPCIKSGRRYLLNMDTLNEFLRGGYNEQTNN